MNAIIHIILLFGAILFILHVIVGIPLLLLADNNPKIDEKRKELQKKAWNSKMFQIVYMLIAIYIAIWVIYVVVR